MSTLPTLIENYLEYCKYQKRLDSKTLKAYRIDLRQFSEQLCSTDVADITQFTLETYITTLSFLFSSMLALERTFLMPYMLHTPEPYLLNIHFHMLHSS